MRKTTKSLHNYELYMDRDSNPRPPQYKGQVLATQPRRSVLTFLHIDLFRTKPLRGRKMNIPSVETIRRVNVVYSALRH
jgi:hypothetical protein